MNFTVKTDENLLAMGKRFKGALPSFFRTAGAYIRKVARNSVKRKADYNKHSMPGTPPYDHSGKGAKMSFKKSILFHADKDGVVIGAIANRLGNIARLHEFGGTNTITYIDHPAYGKKYKVGEIAPVSTKKLKNYKGSSNGLKDPLTGYKVAFIQLETQTMAEHSTRLMARILRETKRFHKTKQISYPARPYMRPAYSKAEPYLLDIYKKQVR